MNIRHIAVPLIILFVIQTFFSSGISHYILTMYGQRYYAEYKLQNEMIYIISTVISAVVNILLAFWIYRRAKDEGKEPLTWSVLTLFFGLLAVILFYLDITYSHLRANSK
jgi:hypothetical protein